MAQPEYAKLFQKTNLLALTLLPAEAYLLKPAKAGLHPLQLQNHTLQAIGQTLILAVLYDSCEPTMRKAYALLCENFIYVGGMPQQMPW